ncbi:MAG: tRNA pseudouridine(55) synthase TruB [Fusicatenibacter sp.]|nr:tRNA pseudouridine(55) synthase TruB [Fusicatenibacter sp.]
MINGILNVCKEPGYTSHDVVAKLRGILHQKKIGHTGTLDPDAEGVLPVCLGKATKLCDLLTDETKTYEALLHLGIATDTQDMSGTVLEQAPIYASEQEVRDCILGFRGEQLQIPPMYSALKVNGKKLYEFAREGIEIERKARKVCFYEIRILECALPLVRMEVTCSKGTYIRTLCNDIGEKLGCHGCMEHLVRTRVGRFTLEKACTLEQIREFVTDGRLDEILVPADGMFEKLDAYAVSDEMERMAVNGNAIMPSALHALGTIENVSVWQKAGNEETRFRLYLPSGAFVGIYEYDKGRDLCVPVKMFLERT